jgi:TetR/AcrR family transcriptional repressor of nem operon
MIDTRGEILQKNFEAMRLYGFQGLRTDKVIAQMGITKGAFYHYFKDKLNVGYAVVDELIAPSYISTWKNLSTQGVHVIDAISNTLRCIAGYSNQETIHLGCPLNNLIQEMSPLDEGFNKRLSSILNEERKMIRQGIEGGIADGTILADTDADALTLFILASLEGSYAIGKSFNSYSKFIVCVEQLIKILNNYKQ